MSSDRPSGAPSSGTDSSPSPEVEPGLAALVRARGSPLLQGLERHQPGAREHADATASYAFAAAVELGFGRAHAEAVREAARLHEVGEVYLPAELIAKPRDELTPEERGQLDSHFEKGADLALGAGIPDRVCEWILAAGKRFDTPGPGDGEAEIPLESRIVRAACACDALLAGPPAGPAGASPRERHRQAIDGLHGRGGRELDPGVVEALVAVLERAAAAAERP
jgi:HD-GYP domain-containing protein (c-di-GMP phosphodiesterase class II)